MTRCNSNSATARIAHAGHLRRGPPCISGIAIRPPPHLPTTDIQDMKTSRATPTPSPLPLDPRSLGRPVHLLDRFTVPLREGLAEFLRTRFNRRYRASFRIGEVTMAREEALPQAPRWRMYGNAGGRIGFAIDRALLLCIFGYRYGAGAEALPAAAPETATEERLATALGLEFAALLARQVARLPGLKDDAAAAEDFAELTLTPPAGACWIVRAQLLEPARAAGGELLLALDEDWSARVLRGVAPLRERRPAAQPADPLAARLQLTLAARLLEKELPLGDLLDARVGDIIPMHLGPTEVLVGDALLFHADVAEHKGKLCLTAFKDVE